jgi:hypothetical protein
LDIQNMRGGALLLTLVPSDGVPNPEIGRGDHYLEYPGLVAD